MDARIVEAVRNLPEKTRWHVVERVDLPFELHHPQGLVKRGDTFYLTSVEVTSSKEELEKVGRGWVIQFDRSGQEVRRAQLAPLSKRFHPGGLDDDGTYLWTAVAEYRPHSQATIMRIDPVSLQAENVTAVSDHLGSVVHNTDDHTLVAANWDAAELYTFDEAGNPVSKRRHPTDFVALQDCKYAGHGLMLGSGVADKRGGLELIDLENGEIVHRVRVDERTPSGVPMTKNPVAFEIEDGMLRLYCVPEDGHGSLYVLSPDAQEGAVSPENEPPRGTH
jgi:hypothetical protein